jgi:two-component system, sensor histidine kinase and response regulator
MATMSHGSSQRRPASPRLGARLRLRRGLRGGGFQSAVVRSVDPDEARARFLANVSHEIRTPLNAIIGLGHLLAAEDMPDTAMRLLRRLHASSQHLLEIVDDVLDLSKIEADELRLEAVPFQLDELLQDLIDILGGRAAEKGLRWIVDTAPAAPRHLVGDPLRLRQVLINLVGNAVKFTPAGHVLLRIELTERSEDQVRLRFEVEDTGIGIDPSRQREIFEPFRQGDRSTSRQHGGTGLGLTISQRLVTSMAGSLGLESEPGRGSRFSFELPFALGTTDRRHFRSADPRRPGQLALLGLVDELEAAALARALGGFGLRTLIASDPLPTLDGEVRFLLLDEELPLARREALSAAAPRALALDIGYPRAKGGLRLSRPWNRLRLFRLLETLSGGDPGPDPPGEDESQTPSFAGRSVLLVEDNETNRIVLEGLLDRLGAQTISVDSGEGALELLDTPVQPDLVLMDLQMPGLDGYETTRRIRASGLWPGLPILALTADAGSQLRPRCLAAGMNDVLTKPIHPRRLASVLQRWLTVADRSLLEHARQDLRGAAPLPALPGIDVAVGLERVAGDAALYRRLLEQFAADGGAIAEHLAETQRHGVPRADLRRELHTLKGLAGTIGASRLRELSLCAEQAAQQPLTAESGELARLARELELVLAGLRNLPSAAVAEEPPAPAQSEPEEGLERLRELLGASDSASQALYRRLRPALAAVLGESLALNTLDDLLQRWQFERAAEYLDLLQTTHDLERRS